jgi:hypothetical protein
MRQYRFPIMGMGMGITGIEPVSSGLQPDARTNSATFPKAEAKRIVREASLKEILLTV